MEPIVIKNVSKTFVEGKETIKALDNVSLSVKAGEILGLLGANGAGKTTLISILIGLLSRDKGKVFLLGKDIDKGMDSIKRKINIITGFTMVDVNVSVNEYLKYFALLYNIKDKKNKINEVIKKVELNGKEKAMVRSLSSGYKQRVLFAKALLNEPKVIFMDEPTVGLDVGIAIKFRKMITALKKEGAAIIFTSHNLSEVEQLCDRIVLIAKGKIVQSGSIEEIKKRIRNNKIVEVACKRTDEFGYMMKELKEVKTVKILGDKVIIEAKTVKDVDKIMRKAINSEHIIISIRKIEPTLEEAFLNMMSGKK